MRIFFIISHHWVGECKGRKKKGGNVTENKEREKINGD
jgi:hypothetical protein